MPISRRYEITFFTATVLEWKFLLANDKYKDIIVDSLKFLVDNKRIELYAFVIMSNHMHVLWHIIHPHTKEEVQRDFLRFTSQMILKDLRTNHPEVLEEYFVGAKDRKHQIWERNPLSVEIWSADILKQKLQYVHNNPVTAGLCIHPEDYIYSSAGFYGGLGDKYGILTAYVM